MHVLSDGRAAWLFVLLLRRRKNDSDMHYQALQAEYSEGLLARQVGSVVPAVSSDTLSFMPVTGNRLWVRVCPQASCEASPA